MDVELIFIVGVVLSVFSVPAVMSAFSEGRAPRVAMIAIIVGGSMVVWALSKNPNGFTLWEIPEIFVRVVARYLT